MAIEIDTQSANYQLRLTQLQAFRAHLAPSIVLFARMGPTKRRQWLQRDPLLREVLKMARDIKGALDD